MHLGNDLACVLISFSIPLVVAVSQPSQALSLAFKVETREETA